MRDADALMKHAVRSPIRQCSDTEIFDDLGKVLEKSLKPRRRKVA